MISVDTKKKELIGDFKNGGREWQPRGKPVEVRTHDCMDRGLGKVNPYGIHDQTANAGWVSVGTDHDTAAFAVESIRRGWLNMGMACHPNARELLITADGGGGNGYRVRLWKVALQAFANETDLIVRVCHFPPGTSKWNKIEHRMFSFISLNWRGHPLISHEVVVNLIGSTRTSTGLTIQAELDTASYPKGVKVSDEELSKLNQYKIHVWNTTRHQVHLRADGELRGGEVLPHPVRREPAGRRRRAVRPSVQPLNDGRGSHGLALPDRGRSV